MQQTELLIELLGAAVLDRPPILPKGVEPDWDALMTMASSHSVIAWVWDSICRLPVEQQPPRQQRINWGLSAQETWDTYFYQKKVLADMLDACQKNNIRLLLLKGIGVSTLYPKPQSRQSSDIDIFLFDDFEKGKELFGRHSEKETVLHDEYCYQGVLVENHKMFVYPNTPVKTLVGQHLLNSLDRVILTPDGYYTFAPLDNFVYLMMHALGHIRFTTDKGLYTLKSIVDLAVFFITYRHTFSRNDVTRFIKKLQLEKSFEVIMYFTEWLLGVDCSAYHTNVIPPKDVEVIHSLFMKGLTIDISLAGSFWEQSKMLWVRFYYYRVIYRYLPRCNNTNIFNITFRRQVGLIRNHFCKITK